MRLTAVVLTALLALTACDDRQADAPSAPTVVTARPAAMLLKDSDGRDCTPLMPGDQKATVILFLMHDCPVANASAPEMARLATEFTRRDVRFFGVYATETAAEISTHRSGYGLPFPGLLDPNGQLARHAGATRVPEAAVFSGSGELLYRGRIDDRAVKPGVTKPVPQVHDLRRALESVLAGRQPDPKFTTAIGCYLPRAE